MRRRSGYRRSSRSVVRGGKKFVWVTTLGNQVFNDTTPATATIVAGSDWTTLGTDINFGATLMSIRGYMSVLDTDATASLDAWRAYVAKYDADQSTGNSPTNVQTYNDEDVLWTAGGQFLTYSMGGQVVAKDYDIGIKSRRKLRRDDTVKFFIQAVNAPSGDFTVLTLWRALLLVK